MINVRDLAHAILHHALGATYYEQKDANKFARYHRTFLKKIAGDKFRVATAQGKQGKQGIWFLLFPDRENTGNFVLTQGKIC